MCSACLCWFLWTCVLVPCTIVCGLVHAILHFCMACLCRDSVGRWNSGNRVPTLPPSFLTISPTFFTFCHTYHHRPLPSMLRSLPACLLCIHTCLLCSADLYCPVPSFLPPCRPACLCLYLQRTYLVKTLLYAFVLYCHLCSYLYLVPICVLALVLCKRCPNMPH